jgi:hypothetical protein
MSNACCGVLPRRQFLADMGMEFTGLARGAMLQREVAPTAGEASVER